VDAVGRNNFAALDGVNIVLRAAMPEGTVFRTGTSRRITIHVWCMMKEDDMIEELIREFTEITIEELLKTLGCSKKQSISISSILTRLSLNFEVDNVMQLLGKSWMNVDFETWKKFVEDAKITRVELKLPNSLYFEFDTGMVNHVCSEKPLKFDFKWMEGYEFLRKKAFDIYIKRMRENSEADQGKRIVRETLG
jgi:hypothetical protein